MNGEYTENTEKMHFLSCGEFPARQKKQHPKSILKTF